MWMLGVRVVGWWGPVQPFGQCFGRGFVVCMLPFQPHLGHVACLMVSLRVVARVSLVFCVNVVPFRFLMPVFFMSS